MTEGKPYKCVNCGAAAAALFKTYGPSVLKLTKCDKCNGIVDKYIEYDPVIVMIDLVLVSREAQRHVLYNTEFKAYWKLFIILLMVETYGLWRGESLFNIFINTACDIHTNTTTLNITELPAALQWEPGWWRGECGGWWRGLCGGWWDGLCGGWLPELCGGWEMEERTDERDLFIWEKQFYVQFLSTSVGVAVFILTVHCAMTLMRPFVSLNEVGPRSLLKAFSLCHASVLLSLPMLVWGAAPAPAPAPAPATRLAHAGLVFLYSYVVYLDTFIVLYGGGPLGAGAALAAAQSARFLAACRATPALRHLLH